MNQRTSGGDVPVPYGVGPRVPVFRLGVVLEAPDFSVCMDSVKYLLLHVEGSAIGTTCVVAQNDKV